MDKWLYFDDSTVLAAACSQININMELPNEQMQNWITPDTAIKNYYDDEWIFLAPPLDIYPNALDNVIYDTRNWASIPPEWLPLD